MFQNESSDPNGSNVCLFSAARIRHNANYVPYAQIRFDLLVGPIGLYRDVWIAAIASSRKSLATQTAAICVRFHGRRVRHVYVTMQITFLARKSALIYRRGLRQRVASLTIDCNGVFAIRAYRPYFRESLASLSIALTFFAITCHCNPERV